jgi:hypothetical protein
MTKKEYHWPKKRGFLTPFTYTPISVSEKRSRSKSGITAGGLAISTFFRGYVPPFKGYVPPPIF